MLTIFVIIPIAILNVWATRRVIRSDEYTFRKKMLIAAIWIVPFSGVYLSLGLKGVGTPTSSAESALPGDVNLAAPEELELQGAPTFSVLRHMSLCNGVPFMDWNEYFKWVSSIDDPEIKCNADTVGRRAWLLHMRDAFGSHFRLHESSNAFLLSSLNNPSVVATVEYITSTRKRIERLLGGVARFFPDEKSILLVMDNEDSYYNYVSNYYPDGGEYAISGGMFINFGCPHFVVVRADLSMIEPVIAHEMTHSAVSHLNLPRWLDEGLAVITEQKLAGVRHALYTPHELRNMHLTFWGDAEIQEFWSGNSFQRIDDGNLLSYELARIIVEQMALNGEAFKNFVLNAKRDDAGAQSASEHMAIDMGAFVCALLEKPRMEHWEPKPSMWEKQVPSNTIKAQGLYKQQTCAV